MSAITSSLPLSFNTGGLFFDGEYGHWVMKRHIAYETEISVTVLFDIIHHQLHKLECLRLEYTNLIEILSRKVVAIGASDLACQSDVSMTRFCHITLQNLSLQGVCSIEITSISKRVLDNAIDRRHIRHEAQQIR